MINSITHVTHTNDIAILSLSSYNRTNLVSLKNAKITVASLYCTRGRRSQSGVVEFAVFIADSTKNGQYYRCDEGCGTFDVGIDSEFWVSE